MPDADTEQELEAAQEKDQWANSMREQSSEEDKQTVFCVIQTAAKNIASYTQSAG